MIGRPAKRDATAVGARRRSRRTGTASKEARAREKARGSRARKGREEAPRTYLVLVGLGFVGRRAVGRLPGGRLDVLEKVSFDDDLVVVVEVVDVVEAGDDADGVAGPASSEEEVELGEEERGKSGDEGHDDEGVHGLGAAESALVGRAVGLGVGEPEVGEVGVALVDLARIGVARDVDVVDRAVDHHGGEAGETAEEGAEFGRRRDHDDAAKERDVLVDEPQEKRSDGGGADEVGHEKERYDFEAVGGLDDGGDVEADHHEARPVRREPVLDEVLRQHCGQPVLQGVDGRRR
mmetsp:Transcript_23873/g.73504  ORF Transcript_23873/g.73504 Transcript_23873/m.73504 type:complete len:293 (-) Transcript_23873:1252-2130(-)